MYPWHFGEFDSVMDDALNTTMDYLIRTGQAVNFREAHETAAQAIAVAWRSGVRKRLRLSNLAIRAVDRTKIYRRAVNLASMRVALMPPNVIAVTGLAFEARIAAGRGVDVLCANERSRSLEWLEASTAYECCGIISFGIAGGLDRRLSPGDWVIASSVVTDTGQFPADPIWARRLLSMVPGSIHAAISGVDAPLADPAAKLRLQQSHGTVAVDMESHVAARIAAARNLPFAACRVILDPASRRLPPAALVPLCRDGTPNLGGVLRSLARDPIQVCGLLRIIVDAWSARAVLKRDRRSLGDGLGFPLPMAACTESFTTGEAQAPGFLPMSSIARHA